MDFTVRQFIAPVALALQDAGYDVRCACTPGPHWQELEEMRVRMVAMPIARSMNPLRAGRSAWRLYKWLRRERPDVLHCHTPVASMIGRLAGWLAGVPLIIYTAHGFYFHDRMPRKKRAVHVALERFFSRFQDVLFCVSKEDAENAARWKIFPRKRIHYIGNGADPEKFHPAKVNGETIRREFTIPPEAAVISIMGRLVREKGYFEFFEAALRLAEEFPKAHFLVVGDTVVSEHDNAKDQILELAEAPVLKDRVHFTGLRRDIPELLAASDIFCLPSYREGMPVSILEAMMMNVPVVATRIRGCREEVEEGKTGFLVEPQNSEELREAIAYCLRHPGVAQKMGEQGRQKALREFDERKILQRQVKIYNRYVRRLSLAKSGGGK